MVQILPLGLFSSYWVTSLNTELGGGVQTRVSGTSLIHSASSLRCSVSIVLITTWPATSICCVSLPSMRTGALSVLLVAGCTVPRTVPDCCRHSRNGEELLTINRYNVALFGTVKKKKKKPWKHLVFWLIGDLALPCLKFHVCCLEIHVVGI